MKCALKFSYLCCVVIMLSSCKYGRVVVYNFADIKDYKKFPSIELQKSNNAFVFNCGNDSLFNKIDNVVRDEQKNYSLTEYLKEDTKTVAFTVIRNDSILYENYFRGYNEKSIVTSFSVAKSFVAGLIGIAIEEGLIGDVKDPITDYIPEFLERDKRFKKISVDHLLNMRSGLAFNEKSYFNPFSKITSLYYGTNHLKLILKVGIKTEPNTRFEYQSINTEILGIILERATGKQLTKYFEEKMWLPVDPEFNASWSIDSEKNRNPKAYCCLNARLKDFAKLGRLYLNYGKWENNQVIDSAWLKNTFTADENNNFYHNHWYNHATVLKDEDLKTQYFSDSLSATKAATSEVFLVKKSIKERGKWYLRNATPSFLAIGILGQYIYINPEKNLMILRFGKRDRINYRHLFSEIDEIL